MNHEDEKLFFEHDIAGPLTNLHGAAYLIRMTTNPSDAGAAEALAILDANLRTLERMVGWYWRTRELARTISASEPWPARALPEAIGEVVDGARLALAPPSGDPGEANLTAPREALAVGLVGAALTLAAASGESPGFTIEQASGVLFCRLTVRGGEDVLDAGRLFRKPYWASKATPEPWVDPGLPYLKTVVEHARGRLDLAWGGDVWSLECSLPVVP